MRKVYFYKTFRRLRLKRRGCMSELAGRVYQACPISLQDHKRLRRS